MIRPKGFAKFMVIGCTDENWDRIKKSCDNLKAIEDKDGPSKTQGPRSNHRVIEDVADGAQALLVGTSATKACYTIWRMGESASGAKSAISRMLTKTCKDSRKSWRTARKSEVPQVR